MRLSIYSPECHLNEREHQIFCLEEAINSAQFWMCFDEEKVQEWRNELAVLKQRRFTDIPTHRPMWPENKKRAADRLHALG